MITKKTEDTSNGELSLNDLNVNILFDFLNDANNDIMNVFFNVGLLIDQVIEKNEYILKPILKIKSYFIRNKINNYCLRFDNGNSESLELFKLNRLLSLAQLLNPSIHSDNKEDILKQPIEYPSVMSYKKLSYLYTINDIFNWTDLEFLSTLNSYNLPTAEQGRHPLEDTISEFIKLLLEDEAGSSSVKKITDIEQYCYQFLVEMIPIIISLFEHLFKIFSYYYTTSMVCQDMISLLRDAIYSKLYNQEKAKNNKETKDENDTKEDKDTQKKVSDWQNNRNN